MEIGNRKLETGNWKLGAAVKVNERLTRVPDGTGLAMNSSASE